MKIFFFFLLFVYTIHAQNITQSANMVIDGFNNEPIEYKHVTPYLLDIARNGHLLDSTTKERLKGLGFNFNRALVSRGGLQRAEGVGLDKFYDINYFRIHYTTSGRNAVSNIDQNSNNIPDYIESMAEIFDFVAQKIHNDMDFVKPPGDGHYSNDYDKGGSGHYDIYVRQLSSNFYGYVQFEQYAQGNGDNEKTSEIIEKNAITSYMAMRNNYTNFNQLSELENIQTTIAHEFFHTIQLGYDGWEKQWLLEATAVWMEEEIYDSINDVYQYMRDWFRYPHRSLDEEGSHAYGSFIFFEYIEQHMGGNSLLKNIFEFSVQNDSYKKDGSHLAINKALNLNGHTFKEALNAMSVANKIMSSESIAANFKYEEADGYPVNGPAIYKTINYQSGIQDFIESSRLNRYASQYIKIISIDPVLVDIKNINGPNGDLQLNAILERNDNSYMVISNQSVNIDPIDYKSIYLSVVSKDTVGQDWNYRLTFKDGKRGTDANLPASFNLSSPYPNPFNNFASFSINALDQISLNIIVIDITGRKITSLYQGVLPVGSYNYKWDAKDDEGSFVGSGVYFIKASDGSTEIWKPITLVK